MQCLHLCFHRHINEVIPTDGGILEERPEPTIRRELQLAHHLAGKELAAELQRLQLPDVDVRTTVADDGQYSAVWGKTT